MKVKYLFMLLLGVFLSLSSCAKAPCNKTGIGFDDKLITQKIPAIGNVVSRQVANTEKRLTAIQISDVCIEVMSGSGGAWPFLKKLKKKWGVSWKVIFEDARCEYTTGKYDDKYMLTIFDVGLVYGMPENFYYDILDAIKESDPEYLKVMFSEELDYATETFKPRAKKMNLLKRTCWWMYNGIRWSNSGTELRRMTLDLGNGRIETYKEYGFDAKCKLNEYTNYADNGVWYRGILDT